MRNNTFSFFVLISAACILFFSYSTAYAVSASSSSGSGTSSSSSGGGGPSCDPCGGSSTCGCVGGEQSCTFCPEGQDCGFGCSDGGPCTTNTYGPCCPTSAGCITSGTGPCDPVTETYPCDTTCSQTPCPGDPPIPPTTTSGTCGCTSSSSSSGGPICDPCNYASGCYDAGLCGGFCDPCVTPTCPGTCGGISCGGTSGIQCTPDIVYVPGGFAVTLSFADTSWNAGGAAGPVMEGTFTGGSWFGPVLQNITGHTEATQPSFVMRQINSTTAPGYPFSLSDTNPTTVEPDFSGNWGTAYALNPTKNLAGANQNVNASNHYNYSLSFTVTQPTRFSIKGFPVLLGGTLQTLTVGASFSNSTPTVTGSLSTHSTTVPYPPQILFNAGDTVRLNWTVTYQ